MLRAVWFTPTVAQAAKGAHWFECAAIALRGDQHLALLRGPLQGVLGPTRRTRPLRALRHRRTRHRRLRAAHLRRPAQLEGAAHGRLPRRALPRRGPRSAPPASSPARPPAGPPPATRSATSGPTSGRPASSGGRVRRTASAGRRRLIRSTAGGHAGWSYDCWAWNTIASLRRTGSKSRRRRSARSAQRPTRLAEMRRRESTTWRPPLATLSPAYARRSAFGARQDPCADRRDQKPSLRSCLGSRCQSLAILTCRSR